MLLPKFSGEIEPFRTAFWLVLVALKVDAIRVESCIGKYEQFGLVPTNVCLAYGAFVLYIPCFCLPEASRRESNSRPTRVLLPNRGMTCANYR